MILPLARKVTLIIVLILAVQSFQSNTMKVHPVPMKRNITFQFGIDGEDNHVFSEAQALRRIVDKKLGRLRHVFSRVLKLPFRFDAGVAVEEDRDCFRFRADTEGIREARAHIVEIYHGVMKIVVRDGGSVFALVV